MADLTRLRQDLLQFSNFLCRFIGRSKANMRDSQSCAVGRVESAVASVLSSASYPVEERGKEIEKGGFIECRKLLTRDAPSSWH